MHTTAAMVSTINIASGPLRPKRKKMPHVKSSVAMVIPEIGLDDEPISPVRREETVTKRKPKTRIITAPINPPTLKPSPSAGTAINTATRPSEPNSTTNIGKSRSVRRAVTTPPVGAANHAGRRGWTRKSGGAARHMLMIPPAATAPAPMWCADTPPSIPPGSCP